MRLLGRSIIFVTGVSSAIYADSAVTGELTIVGCKCSYCVFTHFFLFLFFFFLSIKYRYILRYCVFFSSDNKEYSWYLGNAIIVFCTKQITIGYSLLHVCFITTVFTIVAAHLILILLPTPWVIMILLVIILQMAFICNFDSHIRNLQRPNSIQLIITAVCECTDGYHCTHTYVRYVRILCNTFSNHLKVNTELNLKKNNSDENEENYYMYIKKILIK